MSVPARYAWNVLLNFVKVNGRSGRCRIPDAEEFCRFAWMDGYEKAYKEMVKQAVLNHAITLCHGDYATVEVSNWNRYQGDPTSAQRQASRREKGRVLGSNGSESHGDKSAVTKITSRPDETILLNTCDSAPKEVAKRSRKAKAEGDHPLWEDFYDAYPRPKRSVFEAKSKFGDLLAAGFAPEAIISGARRYASSVNPQYVAMMSTWLNQHRWLDEYSVQEATAVVTNPRGDLEVAR